MDHKVVNVKYSIEDDDSTLVREIIYNEKALRAEEVYIDTIENYQLMRIKS